jgi:hypothetical protein
MWTDMKQHLRSCFVCNSRQFYNRLLTLNIRNATLKTSAPMQMWVEIDQPTPALKVGIGIDSGIGL